MHYQIRSRCGKIFFFYSENGVILFRVSAVMFVEMNRRHYFRSVFELFFNKQIRSFNCLIFFKLWLNFIFVLLFLSKSLYLSLLLSLPLSISPYFSLFPSLTHYFFFLFLCSLPFFNQSKGNLFFSFVNREQCLCSWNILSIKPNSNTRSFLFFLVFVFLVFFHFNFLFIFYILI